MRMKNAIDRTRKYKIKYEMKLFLMVFQSKMNKYYDKNQKGFIKKWHDNTLRLRKIEIFFKILNNAEEQLNKVASNFAFKNIYDESQDTTFILRFINKYLGNYCSKVKKSIDEWKKIPSVKKKKGRVRLRRILENKIRETEE